MKNITLLYIWLLNKRKDNSGWSIPLLSLGDKDDDDDDEKEKKAEEKHEG